MFTVAGSSSSSRMQAIAWAANASLSSIRSIWSIVMPARFRTFCVAGIGPNPMQLGSTPATAVATTRASGAVQPLPPMTSSAAAPSLIPLDVAAVTVPSFLNAGFSFATLSSVVPAHGRVGDVGSFAAPRLARLEHHVGRARHVLDTAGDKHLTLTRLDRLGGARRRLQPRAAQPVHGLARHFDRKTRQEQGHPRHVAVVLAGLIGAAEDHVVDRERIDPAALDDGCDGHGSEIIRAYASQRPTVLQIGR